MLISTHSPPRVSFENSFHLWDRMVISSPSARARLPAVWALPSALQQRDKTGLLEVVICGERVPDLNGGGVMFIAGIP